MPVTCAECRKWKEKAPGRIRGPSESKVCHEDTKGYFSSMDSRVPVRPSHSGTHAWPAEQ